MEFVLLFYGALGLDAVARRGTTTESLAHV
jgi:hypothetical protein